MPTITKKRGKLKSQSAAPVTALASRDRVDVPTAKRRARRPSEPTERLSSPVEAQNSSESRVIAIEACRQAWFVHDLLVGWGNEVVVIDTTRSKQLGIGQHGRKTDRIDAETLAQALEMGRIPKAHVLSPARRELRRVLSVRRALVEARAQLVTTVRGLVREQGARIPSCHTGSFVSRVRAQGLALDVAQLIDPLLVLVQGIDTQLSSTEEQLAALCAQEPIKSSPMWDWCPAKTAVEANDDWELSPSEATLTCALYWYKRRGPSCAVGTRATRCICGQLN
jgi:transposase